MKAFDPILDPSAVPAAQPRQEHWQAAWIWYPGQLGAHLNTRVFQKAIRRCTHIGYPGNFRQPEYAAYYRLRAELPQAAKVRWSAPVGRARVRINGREGDITLRQGLVPAGPVEILAVVDLTTSLPCFLFDGPGLSTGAGWEASLDGQSWVAAEFQHPQGSPTRLPDLDIDSHVTLPPAETVYLRGGREENGGYYLDPVGDLVLDFWHNELGELEISASGNGELHVTVGETPYEVFEGKPETYEQYPLPSLPLHVSGSLHRLPERCLRYVRIQSTGRTHIHRVQFHARVYPVEYRGAFHSSDAQLNDLWAAGAATLHSNIHDAAVLDGLKRDALIWLFDQNIDFDGSDCAFFDREVVRNTLVSKSLPEHPHREDIGLVDMRMYYILGFYQDYLASGDVDFITRYRAQITGLLDLLASLQDGRGFLSARAFSPQAKEGQASQGGVEGVDYLNEFFPDWAAKSDRAGEVRPTDLDCAGTPAYAQMMLMRCFEIGETFAGLWSDPDCAKRYGENARRLRQSILEAFWDGPRGAFINGLTRQGQRDERISLYAQAWGLLLDLVASADMDRVAAGMAAITPRPANISMATYWEYLAYIKAGRLNLVLDPLRRYWGQMLERGLSRFIEDIRPADSEKESLVFYGRPYAISFNHGWTGAVAVSILSRGVLGLQILEPGYKRVELRPNWRAFEQISVRLPAPQGSLTLKHDAQQETTLEIPEGMQVVIRDGAEAQEFTGPGTFSL